MSRHFQAFLPRMAPALVVLMLFLGLGCGQQGPNEEAEKASSILPPEPKPVAQAACPEGVVATVDDRTISLEDAEKRAKMNLRREGIDESSPEFEAKLKIARKGAVDYLIEAFVLQAAATTTIVIATEEVEAEISAIKGRHPNRESYEEGLRLADLTEEGLRELLRRDLQIRRTIAIEAARGVPTPTPEQARQFYEVNTMIFSWPYRVRYDEVVWPFRPDVTEASREQAMAEMQILSDRFRADPKAFDEMVRTATMAVWGPIGVVNPYQNLNEMPQSVQDTLKTLNVDEPSLPVKTDLGISILAIRSNKQTFESAYQEIRQSLYDAQVRENMDLWKNRERAKHRIQICPDMMDYYEGTGEWQPSTETETQEQP